MWSSSLCTASAEPANEWRAPTSSLQSRPLRIRRLKKKHTGKKLIAKARPKAHQAPLLAVPSGLGLDFELPGRVYSAVARFFSLGQNSRGTTPSSIIEAGSGSPLPETTTVAATTSMSTASPAAGMSTPQPTVVNDTHYQDAQDDVDFARSVIGAEGASLPPPQASTGTRASGVRTKVHASNFSMDAHAHGSNSSTDDLESEVSTEAPASNVSKEATARNSSQRWIAVHYRRGCDTGSYDRSNNSHDWNCTQRIVNEVWRGNGTVEDFFRQPNGYARAVNLYGYADTLSFSRRGRRGRERIGYLPIDPVYSFGPNDTTYQPPPYRPAKYDPRLNGTVPLVGFGGNETNLQPRSRLKVYQARTIVGRPIRLPLPGRVIGIEFNMTDAQRRNMTRQRVNGAPIVENLIVIGQYVIDPVPFIGLEAALELGLLVPGKLDLVSSI